MWITISFRKTCLGYGRVPAGYVEIYRTSSQHLLKVQPHVVVIAFTFVFVCAVNNVVNIELQVHTYIHKRRTVSSWHTCHFETRQKKTPADVNCVSTIHTIRAPGCKMSCLESVPTSALPWVVSASYKWENGKINNIWGKTSTQLNRNVAGRVTSMYYDFQDISF